MKPTPLGWPRMSAGVYYRDAARMIDWLCSAFGFVLQLKVEGEGGRIEHSQLTFGGGLTVQGLGTGGGTIGAPFFTLNNQGTIVVAPKGTAKTGGRNPSASCCVHRMTSCCWKLRRLEEAQASARLHRATCSFKKTPGHVYHLYRRDDGELYFSMLSPTDWRGAPPHPFEGSYRLEADQSFTLDETARERPDPREVVRQLLAGRLPEPGR